MGITEEDFKLLGERIEKLQEENKEMRHILKFIYNPYSSPGEILRRVSERYEEVQECLAKLGEESTKDKNNKMSAKEYVKLHREVFWD